MTNKTEKHTPEPRNYIASGAEAIRRLFADSPPTTKMLLQAAELDEFARTVEFEVALLEGREPGEEATSRDLWNHLERWRNLARVALARCGGLRCACGKDYAPMSHAVEPLRVPSRVKAETVAPELLEAAKAAISEVQERGREAQLLALRAAIRKAQDRP